MNITKLTEVYEQLHTRSQLPEDYMASTASLYRNIGKALNSLEVILDAPLKDKEAFTQMKADLNHYLELAIAAEQELKQQSESSSQYP